MQPVRTMVAVLIAGVILVTDVPPTPAPTSHLRPRQRPTSLMHRGCRFTGAVLLRSTGRRRSTRRCCAST